MITADKIEHFIAGALIVVVSYKLGLRNALLLLLLAAFGKEFSDSLGYGKPELLDLAWTLSGGGLVLSLLSFFKINQASYFKSRD